MTPSAVAPLVWWLLALLLLPASVRAQTESPVDTPPAARTLPAPLTPPRAQQRGIIGRVEVTAWVSEQGRVQGLYIQKRHTNASGSDTLVFDQAALAAVVPLEFWPAFYRQRPVAAWADVVVAFGTQAGAPSASRTATERDRPLAPVYADEGPGHMATVRTATRFRSGPSMRGTTSVALAAGELLYLFSTQPTDGYYRALRVLSDEEGWVSAGAVRVGERVETGASVLTSAGRSDEASRSELDIQNDSDRTITLTLGGTRHRFSPRETRTVTVAPGTYTMIASSPGVRPFTSRESVEGGSRYSWRFFIRTVRR